MKLSKHTATGFLIETRVYRGPNVWLLSAWSVMLSCSILVYYGAGKLAMYLLSV